MPPIMEQGLQILIFIIAGKTILFIMGSLIEDIHGKYMKTIDELKLRILHLEQAQPKAEPLIMELQTIINVRSVLFNLRTIKLK